MKLWSEIILPPDHCKDAIVFLHGTGSNSSMWKSQMAFFSKLGHPCISVDLRGHGYTHEPYEITNLNTHIEDILQTLPTNQMHLPAYFVGHSLGAIISLFLANKQPELVKGIFAACLPGRIIAPVKTTFGLFIDGPLQVLKGSGLKQYLGWRERTLIEMPLFTLGQIYNHFAGLDLLRALPPIDCPIHLACGRFDPIALCQHTKELQQKMPGSTLKIFEWGGHNFMDANSRTFNAWILQHLR